MALGDANFIEYHAKKEQFVIYMTLDSPDIFWYHAKTDQSEFA